MAPRSCLCQPYPKLTETPSRSVACRKVNAFSCSDVAPVNRHVCLLLLLQAAAPVAPDSPSVCAPGGEEQPKGDAEDFEDLSSVLQHLGLSEYKTTFNNEKIDIESFVRIAAILFF